MLIIGVFFHQHLAQKLDHISDGDRLTFGEKVLVVHDDTDIRELICLILAIEGYEIFSLANGHGILDEVAEKKPDLILPDVRLGDMDGQDICKAIKDQPDTNFIKIILVAATHGKHTRMRRSVVLTIKLQNHIM